jgi:hypothetical protein
MSNILLVEPDYSSKFPPLGLLRLSTYHRAIGDNVTYTRGCDPKLRSLKWHRVYVSSLFTYELPRTIRTIKYYRQSVDAEKDIIVGGIAATLLPDYIRQQVPCHVVTGPLDKPRLIGGERKPIAKYLPDYSIIDSGIWNYQPKYAYFCRVTTGCIRHCKFCAVPFLEPEFAYFQKLRDQIRDVVSNYGERQNLVLLDNNITAYDDFDGIVADIRRAGFEKGQIWDGRQRTVDFNQGIDARLITNQIAAVLSTIALSPVRLAFDFSAIEKAYVRATKHLVRHGFEEFTNYVMFNYSDDPRDFYHRIRLNAKLSQQLEVRITGFPMKYTPITDVSRRFISPNWKWRYLRGLQCVLLATHGLVSPNLEFFNAAFGFNFEEFLEILSMPDRYIIFRRKYEANAANDWRKLFRKLLPSARSDFLDALALINRSRDKKGDINHYLRFSRLLEHYYPNGKPTPCE